MSKLLTLPDLDGRKSRAMRGSNSFFLLPSSTSSSPGTTPPVNAPVCPQNSSGAASHRDRRAAPDLAAAASGRDRGGVPREPSHHEQGGPQGNKQHKGFHVALQAFFFLSFFSRFRPLSLFCLFVFRSGVRNAVACHVSHDAATSPVERQPVPVCR